MFSCVLAHKNISKSIIMSVYVIVFFQLWVPSRH